ncbi:hypothetical protein BDM02DRAFT_478080 [Thelephora ganbajun]|uniref:Uncharacterized protein n=1 Tax=Thelephora ganbajun TaxID=370292 RepID=A0ACB6Z8I7_THEGA|nr:hypothetical protein BDM02DRAFT_478080 [Thelephora ganbajun]
MSLAPASTTESERPELELSLSQLLNALDKKLDNVTENNSNQTEATILKQVDDVITRISDIWRKARNVKNSFAPINKLPPETLATVAGFLKPGLQLINATAVCQYWRATLLSFPRLWNKIRSSNWVLFEAYLERSRSILLKVRLYDKRAHLAESLVPHVSRLASLAIVANNSSNFRTIARYLRKPIPTLHKLSITTPFEQDVLELPSDIGNDHFLHVKKLRLDGMSSFRAPYAFVHVTDFKWDVRSPSVQVAGLLDTMEQLPALERVEIIFRTRYVVTNPVPHLVTLAHMQRMSLRCTGEEIPPILEFLKLPSLTYLFVDTAQTSRWCPPILPNTFDQHLPNFAELPEMRVYVCNKYGRAFFQSPSQASLEHYTHPRSPGETLYLHKRKLWGGLPLHSVGKLIVTMTDWTKGLEAGWLCGLLPDLGSLEHLELEGYCGYTVDLLCEMVEMGDLLLRIRTLTVRSGEHAIRQALRFKEFTDELGLGIIVTCIPAPEFSSDDD